VWCKKAGLSHAHTVVWECCKDDRQSQWGMAKFDPLLTLNPYSDRHQIWNTWLLGGYFLPKKFGLNPPSRFCPTYTRTIHPNAPNVYFTFFLPKVYRRARWTDFHALYVIWRGYAQGSSFWELENLNLKFDWVIKSQKSKFYNCAYGEFLNCHNSTCTQDIVVNLPLDYPCCHGNEIWDQIAYNSASWLT